MEKIPWLRFPALIAIFSAALSLAFLWSSWPSEILHAQVPAGAQALAAIGKGGTTGIRTFVWTAQQPAVTNNWRSSPVAVCTLTPPCEFTETRKGYYVETGYNKGDNSPRPNVLQQYAAWTSPNPGESGFDWNLGDLSDNTWYKFVVVSDPTSNLWLIKRGGQQVDSIGISNIGYGSGRMVDCGAEAGLPGTSIAVQCNNMQYQYQGTWTLFNYTYAQTTTNYCVDSAGQYDATGYGPC